MIKVKVVIPENVGAPSNATLERALHAIVAYAKDRITTEAQNRLSPRVAQEYIRAINEPGAVKMRARGFTLGLNGKLPNALEQGTPSFSIKDAMLKGPTAKAQGYVDVPFRHGAPGSSSRVGGPTPKNDWDVMRQVVRSAQSAARAAGMNKHQVQALQIRGPRKMPTPPQPQHKVSLYADMLRVPKTYAKGTGAQYLTFRRISEKSAPGSWIHPGLKGVAIFPRVMKDIQRIAAEVIADYTKHGL